ncbi:endonuclease III [Candidatus Pantoea carbekii]|uniref:Endonuclease III n=1 Tax=Candidatus Pantoea carbekii TaxID=1235990 RepID=U3U815_9GAMM|nr:endonuclease III [Candidatus Pantoea carbekii]AKC32081.1 DNA-(apurinic or apyrimidinic site) lyase [Candidatus Pantoea carbekii]BAO00607.1 endonuclease III [Candidatus Pantoea carbekii]
MNKNKRIQILMRLQNKHNHPVIELNFQSPFELLIAVLLSAKSTDARVNKATDKLYRVANTPETILALGTEELKKYIKSLGLFNRKSENITKLCYILLEKYAGNVPEDRTALQALPGVGRKTANVVLNIAFGWRTIAVDTHIFRVSNRTGFALGKNVKEVEEKLLKVVPRRFQIYCHSWLILHGRYTCIARKPHCHNCVIQDLCEYEKN